MTLSDEMKAHEHEARSYLTPKQYAVVRLDGKAFHTYTRGLDRPFDLKFMSNMDEIAKSLCAQVSNVKFAYVQSDEISLIMTDWSDDETVDTQPYFGGQIQKITSVTASLAAGVLGILAPPADVSGLGLFDSRAFNLTDRAAAESYVIWRHRDAIKNSLSMAAQAEFSHKVLQGVRSEGMHHLLDAIDKPWIALPQGFRHGRLITRQKFTEEVAYVNKETKATEEVTAVRNRWVSDPAPELQSDEGRAYLQSLLPFDFVG